MAHMLDQDYQGFHVLMIGKLGIVFNSIKCSVSNRSGNLELTFSLKSLREETYIYFSGAEISFICF